MRRILRRQQTECIRTIQMSFIKNIVIRVNSFLPSITIEIHLASDSINLRNRAGYPSTVCQLILQVSCCCIIQIIMSPTVTFGTEQDFFSVIQERNITHLIIEIRLVFFMNHHTHFSGLYIHFANIRLVPCTVIALEVQTFSVF